MDGAKLITFAPRLSNTASLSDVWLPTWPGSVQTVLLAIANHLIQNDLYDKEFVRRWVNWEETLEAVASDKLEVKSKKLSEEIRLVVNQLPVTNDQLPFELFDALLKDLRRIYV